MKVLDKREGAGALDFNSVAFREASGQSCVRSSAPQVCSAVQCSAAQREQIHVHELKRNTCENLGRSAWNGRCAPRLKQLGNASSSAHTRHASVLASPTT